jgi:membrane protein
MYHIWGVMLPEGQPLRKRIRQKIVPFVLVSALGVIVLAWTAMSSGLYGVIMLFSINGALVAIGITVAQILLSFGVATLLLAIIYKMIPDARVHWQDVILAFALSGIAFTATNYIFGTYVSAFTVITVSGAAGSLLIILLWIFALNEIVLFGAEISEVHAITVGEHEKQHLPEPVGKVVELVEKAGEMIEDVTKEDVVKIPEAT